RIERIARAVASRAELGYDYWTVIPGLAVDASDQMLRKRIAFLELPFAVGERRLLVRVRRVLGIADTRRRALAAHAELPGQGRRQRQGLLGAEVDRVRRSALRDCAADPAHQLSRQRAGRRLAGRYGLCVIGTGFGRDRRVP